MNETQKLAFISNMTDKALHHAARTPNVVTPKGMSHDKMMSFVTSMTKHGVEHLDAGGAVGSVITPGAGSGNTTAGGVGGAISGFLGTSNGFQASGIPIQSGTNSGQLATAYNQSQTALGNQQNQVGLLGNQENQGAGNQSTLANMYLNQAQGGGPNPAQAALNQNTGQNIAQTAALIAGQRGAAGNAGALALGGAQQGANLQQQAVGQAATQEAQQQLAAEQNLQNLSANQVAQGTTAVQGLNSATQNEQNILQGANTSANNTAVNQQSNINTTNAGISSQNSQSAGNVVGGVLKGISSVAGLFAKGGMVQKPAGYATGGVIQGQATSGPQSYVGNWLNSTAPAPAPMQSAGGGSLSLAPGADPFGGLAGDINSLKRAPAPSLLNDQDVQNIGNQAPLLSTGASDLSGPLGDTQVAYKGGLMKDGGKVKADKPSEDAVKKGDSLKNDKIPTMLSQGEIVIPRHITMAPDAPAKAALFVAQELKKRRGGK